MLRAIYAGMKLLPIKHKVVFLSRQSNRHPRDFNRLEDELRTIEPSAEIVQSCRRVPDRVADLPRFLVGILPELYHLATARVAIVNGYSIAVCVLDHRPELTVIQIWHALGAIKRFGFQSVDMPDGRPADLVRIMRMHRNYDYVLCGGEGSIGSFAEAFGVDRSNVLPIGLPRVDDLVGLAEGTVRPSQSTRRFLSSHPTILDRSIPRILYAPTNHEGVQQGIASMVERFGSDAYTLILKPHSNQNGELLRDNVVDATGINVQDLLLYADVLVTDYSAVAFEGYCIDKPVYYFVPGIEEYESRRGLNTHPLREYPSVSTADIEELGRWIDEGRYDHKLAAEMKARYLPYPLEGCTHRIAHLIVDHLHATGNADA